jgi:hypothetical protein
LRSSKQSCRAKSRTANPSRRSSQSFVVHQSRVVRYISACCNIWNTTHYSLKCPNDHDAGDKAELAKAYKKALAKHHPDRAQRSANSWQEVPVTLTTRAQPANRLKPTRCWDESVCFIHVQVTEAEEIYKLIQNKHSEWEAGKLPSSAMPTRPKSGASERVASIHCRAAVGRCAWWHSSD